MRNLVSAVAVTALVCSAGGCRGDRGKIDAASPPAPCTAIAKTRLCWRVPGTWQVAPTPEPALREPQPAAAQAAKSEDASYAGGIALDRSELVASGERQRAISNAAIPARVEVYRDLELPPEISPTDYLVANRMAQKRALGTISVRHLEVEPIQRDNRRGFHLRDAFDVPLPQGGQAPVSQQALLLLDGRTGYIVAVTMMEDERALLAEEIRSWLNSVSFVGADGERR
ncbi:MAG: hypothetical protein JXR83_20060 [Deltaproteobacteria bacterium]|nr:hypothetical protein [Deltaproteobacteria bacterium]